ncbi:MAG: hypothetical protein AAFY98_10615 [Verrucomicrobiota bacterium]
MKKSAYFTQSIFIVGFAALSSTSLFADYDNGNPTTDPDRITDDVTAEENVTIKKVLTVESNAAVDGNLGVGLNYDGSTGGVLKYSYDTDDDEYVLEFMNTSNDGSFLWSNNTTSNSMMSLSEENVLTLFGNTPSQTIVLDPSLGHIMVNNDKVLTEGTANFPSLESAGTGSVSLGFVPDYDGGSHTGATFSSVAGNYAAAFSGGQATGHNSFAHGAFDFSEEGDHWTYRSQASGSESVAFSGGKSTARGAFSMNHAKATGVASFAFGLGDEDGATVASGRHSFAFGDYPTKATADYSFAFGDNATAEEAYASAFGKGARSLGRYSFTAGELLFSSARGSVSFGRYNTGGGDPISWVDTDPLFQLGNGAASNNRSNAFEVKKNGDTYIAGNLTGGTAAATGANSFAFGPGANAAGPYSFAFGPSTNASHMNAIAFGSSSTSSGTDNIAIGYRARALGSRQTTAIGHKVTANNRWSIAIGAGATANGSNSIAIGIHTEEDDGDFIDSATATTGGIAIGSDVKATNGLAMGRNSEAIGSNSVALGYSSDADALYSVAIGRSISVLGQHTGASVIGYSLNSSETFQMTVGSANASASGSAFVVGAGDISVSPAVGANAMVVQKNGTVEAHQVRVAAGGDISMGSFTAGTDPRTVLDPNQVHWTPTP